MTDLPFQKLPTNSRAAEDFARRPDTRFDPARETLQPLFYTEGPVNACLPRQLPPRATAAQLALSDAQGRDALPLPRLAPSSPAWGGQTSAPKAATFRPPEPDAERSLANRNHGHLPKGF